MSNSAKDERDFQNAGDTEMSGGEKSTRNKRRGRGAGRLEHWQIIALLLMAYDFVVVNLSYFLALWIRFDCKYSAIKKEYLFCDILSDRIISEHLAVRGI